VSRLRERAETGDLIVMDGGMGTTIEDRGCDVRQALWGSLAVLSEAGRQSNRAIHRDFAAAGAELLIANTHNARAQACGEYLESHGTGGLDEVLRADLEPLSSAARAARLCRTVNDLAIENLRQATAGSEPRLLAACLSSPKAAYAATGPGPAEVCDELRVQAGILARHDLDLLIFELLTTEGDLLGCAELAREQELAHVGFGLTCGEGGRTLGGVTMADAVRWTPGAAAYFVQCTRYDLVGPALEALLGAVDGSAVVGVYANDRRVWKDRRWHGPRVEPERYAAEASKWKVMGAQVIGGCCGTTPAHIERIAKDL
jgi:homocysteine S-methyltransferase